jgi:hypothetical protein
MHENRLAKKSRALLNHLHWPRPEALNQKEKGARPAW